VVFRDPKTSLAWAAAILVSALGLNVALVAVVLSACVLSPSKTHDTDCDRAKEWMAANAGWVTPVTAIVFGPWRQIFRIP
jgi:hypothetical protein